MAESETNQMGELRLATAEKNAATASACKAPSLSLRATPAQTVSAKPNLIYDIGLHQGEDTEFYLEKGFEVIAFEANPELADHCRRKFAAQIADQRLVIVEGAIVDPASFRPTSTVKFYQNHANSVWGTVYLEWAQRNESLGAQSDVIEVRAVNIADCLRLYGIPHYMKIDIEGADVVCLRALLDFDIRPDYVSLESDKRDFRKLTEELQLLERLGYSRFLAVQQANVQSQSPPQPPLEGKFVNRLFPDGASGLFGQELPGRWKTRAGILRQYRWIFLLYKLFGDFGILKNSRVGRRLERELAKLLNQPVPGWYDTHARHAASQS
jgi:FkbM family methyltransferase